MEVEEKLAIIEIVTVAQNDLVNKINTNFDHMSKRFDDVNNRLECIESKLKIVHKDTQILPDIFEILENDGRDIARIVTRVDNLEK